MSGQGERNEQASTDPKEDLRILILGGIQIMIGVMHPGFGVIGALLSYSLSRAWGFGSISFVSGYPFWGGLCFIVSGAITISALQEHSSSLLKGSLGMNIFSCMFSIIGVILLLVDLCTAVHHRKNYWTSVAGKGISAMLLLFSVLEFCIACATAHVVTQVIRNPSRVSWALRKIRERTLNKYRGASLLHPYARSALVIPNVYAANPVMLEFAPGPPRSDSQLPYAPRY
ncbi:PREDICTED: membrane-spanning 4-domains subfamily A member 12-like [Chinchilla lanigera]|uniref:membrane-spanning 4-domains subfamily A member 12-like n=1 Tax=Chinchilla lanigera TaxID=34839 RepID=UPI000698460E|nr:PREDICTED: membrane-spanning 4-domains subfamily A member 12-like [Chinchilla lanigera]